MEEEKNEEDEEEECNALTLMSTNDADKYKKKKGR